MPSLVLLNQNTTDRKIRFDIQGEYKLINYSDTKMMMNTVRNSIYYLLYIYPNMYK